MLWIPLSKKVPLSLLVDDKKYTASAVCVAAALAATVGATDAVSPSRDDATDADPAPASAL